MRIKPWRTDLKRWLEQPPQIKDGSIYTASRHHQVQALDAKDGSVKWSTDCSDQILEVPKLVGDDTVLIQGRSDETGSLIGLDRSTGTQKWARDFSPRWKYDDLALQNGTIVVRRSPLAGEDSEPMLMGLSSDNGEALWSVGVESKNWGVPVAGPDNRIFVNLRGKEKESVMALNGENGEVLWRHDGELWGQPKPTADGVLLASRDGLSLLDAESGQVKWSHSQGMTREPLLTKESIVLADVRRDDIPGTRLTGLNPTTGEVRWNYDTPHLTGVAEGPNGQLLHHAYKLDKNGEPQFYLHGLDNLTGKGLWSLELGSAEVEGLGVDQQDRVTVAIKQGRRREVLVLEDGDVKWRRAIEGKGVSIAGTDEYMVLMDRQGLTVVDADTGNYLDQVTVNSPLSNYDGQVAADGRMAMSGIDGELISLQLPGASQIMEPTASTPGRIRHYRYAIGENSDQQVFADVKADGEFQSGEDALLVRHRSSNEHDHLSQNAEPVTAAGLVALDRDKNGYLSRDEMGSAALSLWWDRDHDGEMSRGDGLVAMSAEGNRQAVVDIDRQQLEVRTRPIGG